MKRLLLTLLALTFSGSVAAEWVKIAEKEGTDFYMDPKTFRGNGNFIKVWELTDSDMPNELGIRSFREQVEYDCKGERYRSLYRTFHSGEKADGGLLVTDNKPTEWSPIPPDTIMRIKLNLLCFSSK